MAPLSLRITRNELARTLSLLRVSRGWTQQDLAHAAGLSTALVSNAENRNALPPSTNSLELMVEAMGFPLSILARARDFLRELDREVRRQDERRESPAWARELPQVSVEPRSFPGPRTTNWSSPRFARR